MHSNSITKKKKRISYIKPVQQEEFKKEIDVKKITDLIFDLVH